NYNNDTNVTTNNTNGNISIIKNEFLPTNSSITGANAITITSIGDIIDNNNATNTIINNSSSSSSSSQIFKSNPTPESSPNLQRYFVVNIVSRTTNRTIIRLF